MKAVAIALRIADFLKQFPPFQFLPTEALVGLASGGRVKFHESGEIVFTQGQPRTQYIYVIRQGKVKVLAELKDEEKLIDLRGEGDLLGLNGLLSDEPYQHSARTEAETILYALPREQFLQEAKRSPAATRYLAAYFSLNPAYQPDTGTVQNASMMPSPMTLRKGGLYEVDEPHEVARENLVTVQLGTPLRSAAQLLCSKRIKCVLVVDESGRALGKLTDADIRDRVLQGMVNPDDAVERYMFTDLIPARPGDNTGRLLIRLTRSGKHFLVVTADGTLQSKAIGLVSERSIFLQYGRFPTVLGEAIASAPDIPMLRKLRDRVEALILEFLEDRSSLSWLMEMVGVLNRKMAQRIVELAVVAMERNGFTAPAADYCWLMMGSGGRDELLIRSAVYHAMVYEDPAPGDEPATMAYYKELAHLASQGLRQCGFMESPQGVMADQAGWCLPMSAMKAKYTRFIEDPIQQNVYNARDAFDFRPVIHRCRLAQELREHIRNEIDQHPQFIRHMASDSLLNQPPRTLFQHYVVDEKGIQKEELEIKFHAILPLVDMARVYALDAGKIVSSATSKRLEVAAEAAAESDPAAANLLRESAQAFKLVAYARVRRGLISGTDGAVIRPANLDAETRTLLKTAFRTILELLEYTAKRYDLSLRY